MTARSLWIPAAVLWLLGSPAWAAKPDCPLQAVTDLEQLYCDLIARGEGASLPSPTDFRRNDPRVQALLLRRPAQRHGLVVPEPTSLPQSDTPESAVTAAAPPVPDPKPATPVAPPRPVFDSPLSECQLSGERIRCPGGAYRLAENLPNNQLSEGVLEADNQIGLIPFDGNRGDEVAVRRYLSEAYDRYIPAMLGIGLGANTMSFTAFHNAFHTLEGGGVDFAARMEETFRLLKEDKKTLAVKARYHNELPESLSQCQPINRNVIVCDNVRTNWVYVKAGR